MQIKENNDIMKLQIIGVNFCFEKYVTHTKGGNAMQTNCIFAGNLLVKNLQFSFDQTMKI